MKKFISLIMTAVFLCACVSVQATDAPPSGPTVTAKAAVLMEKTTGEVLYEYNAHQPLPPASVTKVMSLLLICEALNDGRISLSDVVTTSEHAASMGGSQIYLAVGEQMNVEDMLKSVVLGSANDAVVALGEHIAGSEEAFVSMMNARAKELGMADTTFKNASGLPDDGHVTSAYDIAVMSRALLLEYPDIEKYSTTWMDSVRNGAFQLANTNKLIKSYSGATGLKTGSTEAAGCCLAASARRDGTELVCSILGSPTSNDRFSDAKSLLDYGFANYATVEVFPDDVLLPVPVVLGKQAEVQPEIEGGNFILLKKDRISSLVKTVELCDSVEAPVEAGDELGKMLVYSGEELLLTIPITASESVGRLSFGDIAKNLLGRMFMGE